MCANLILVNLVKLDGFLCHFSHPKIISEIFNKCINSFSVNFPYNTDNYNEVQMDITKQFWFISQSENCHCDQPQYVSKDQLLVYRQV